MVKYYTYVDFTLENPPRPFYVGKGNSKRVRKKERNKLHKYISDKYGYKREIVFESDLEQDVLNKEIELIASYKTNVLKYIETFGANFTDGGEGTSGYKLSEEHKRKISQANIGNKHSTGLKHPVEFGQNISKRLKGKTRSSETVQKISNSLKGSKLSKESIAKREISKIKNGTSNKGHKHSEESKIKMRKPKSIPCSEEHKNKLSKINSGRTWKIIDGKRVWLERKK